jgi:hypothetical protein
MSGTKVFDADMSDDYLFASVTHEFGTKEA